MANTRQKIDKLQPLIKVRKMQFDQETMLLNLIHIKREEAILSLQHSQKMYIEGVEKLNRERQSSERKLLDALEQGVDFAKAQWYQKLKNLRLIEEDARHQMIMVNEAQRRMKMLENIDERYDEQLVKQTKIMEQKELDEFAIQMNRRKAST
jgi:hypothetical protein